MNWLLDMIPWWVWLVLGGGVLAVTFPYWRPFWALLPSPVKGAIIIIGTAGLAYLAGRNRGASGVLERAKEKEQARADDILKRGSEARSRADRDAVDPRMHDDGWRRKDG